MKVDWKKVKLGDVATLVTDFVASGSFASLKENVEYKRSPDYAVLVRLVDFNNSFSNSLYVDEKGYKFLRKSNQINIECISCENTDSSNPDFVQPVKPDGKSYDRPVNQMELRICSAFSDKYKKYQQWKANLTARRIIENKPYVIAINSSLRDVGSYNGYSLTFNLLFGYGLPEIHYPSGEACISSRESLKKRQEIDIPIGMFRTKDYQEVSAVICCENDIINTPNEIGSDCILINNPNARLPIKASQLSTFTKIC